MKTLPKLEGQKLTLVQLILYADGGEKNDRSYESDNKLLINYHFRVMWKTMNKNCINKKEKNKNCVFGIFVLVYITYTAQNFIINIYKWFITLELWEKLWIKIVGVNYIDTPFFLKN